MPDLQMLPEDLLDLIVGSLSGSSSLAALARASKLFNRLTLPHLYRHISLLHGVPGSRHWHLLTLAASILRKPELAALVRKFTLRDTYATEHLSGPPKNDKNWTGWPQDCELDHTLRAAINAQLIQCSDSWTTDTWVPTTRYETGTEFGTDESLDIMAAQWFRIARLGCNEAAVLALLLPTLSNLQFLDIPFTTEWNGMGDEGKGRETHFMVDMAERASASRTTRQPWSTFSRLTDVMISGDPHKCPDDPAMLAACIGLPAVKRIYAFNIGNDGRSDDNTADPSFEKLRSNSSAVEFIQLRYSELSGPNLSNLLQAPVCLKEFIYEIGNPWAMTNLDFAEVQQALNFQKESLQRLQLNYLAQHPLTGHDMFVHSITNDTLQPLSFRDFHILRHLRAASVYLYGGSNVYLGDLRDGTGERHFSQDNLESTRKLLREALPPCLETLSLDQCNHRSTLERLYISVKELLSHKAENFSNLREITISGEDVGLWDHYVERFAALPWATNGIRLIMRQVNYTDARSHDIRKVDWGWDEDVKWADCRGNVRGATCVLYDSKNS